MKIYYMPSFKTSKSDLDKKTLNEAMKQILMFLFELFMTMIPILLFFLLFSFIKDREFPWSDVAVDGELLWFSITSLTFIIIQAICSEKKISKFLMPLYILSGLFLVVFDFVFIFFKTASYDLLSVSLDISYVIKFTVLATLITVIIKSAVIIAKGGAES